MKEIKQIIQAYEAACKQRKKAALATVVHIEGSAYRSPGARMLVTEDGMLIGAISGGCLEGDALRKALLVMMEGKPLLATYNTADEDGAAWGVGLGCNGIIRVLIEPLTAGSAETPISLFQWIVEERQPAILVTFFTPEEKRGGWQGTYFAEKKGRTRMIGTSLPLSPDAIVSDVRQVMAKKTPAFVQYPSTEGRPEVTAFIEYVAPPPALIVAGAGNDVLPLVQLAKLLGWDLTLIDGRPNYADPARFPSCRVRVAEPENALCGLCMDEQTALVLMSHNYDYDKAIFKEALGTPVSYIGLLGPVKKRDRMLAELQKEGISVSPTAGCIFGPIGLDIGAETPEEIALSVVAEIKAVFAKRSGRHLRDLSGPIHQRRTAVIAPMNSYGIILLAAGASKRLGTAKQQLLYRGKTLLQHALHEALGVGAGTTVVISGSEEIPLEGPEVEIVFNDGHEEGIAASIRKGVEHISQNHPLVEHLLVMLCDQPHVNTAHLVELIHLQQTTGKRIVASLYEGRKGAPALFHRSLFPQLMDLHGDTGAKYIIEHMGDDVAAVPFPLGAVDIDTAEDYRRAVGSTEAS